MHILLRLRLSLRKHRCFCRAANKDMIERWFNNKAFLQSSLQNIDQGGSCSSSSPSSSLFLAAFGYHRRSGRARRRQRQPAARARCASRAVQDGDTCQHPGGIQKEGALCRDGGHYASVYAGTLVCIKIYRVTPTFQSLYKILKLARHVRLATGVIVCMHLIPG